jgi:hypothetical protein
MELSKDAGILATGFWLLIFIIFSRLFQFILNLIKPIKPKEPEPKLDDPNWDPLAEMLQGGESQPIDSKRVIEWLLNQAKNIDNWEEIKMPGYKNDEYINKINKSIKVFYLICGEYYVGVDGEKVKFFSEEDQKRFDKNFEEALQKKIRQKQQELANKQLEKISNAMA